MKVTLSGLRELACRARLEDQADYLLSLDRVTEALRGTSGIVHLPKGRPTLVVPDLHARRDFLLKALEHQLEDTRCVHELLESGSLNLLCLGDGMHSEERGQHRWEEAARLCLPGLIPQRALKILDAEMVESLGLMKMVMDLKAAHPRHFHYLRGNHDQVMGYVTKYAPTVGEARLVRNWMLQRFGEDFLNRYRQFENLLPLMALGPSLVASHSAPGRELTGKEIESRSPTAEKALCWTSNSRRDVDGSYLFETEENHANLESILRTVGRPQATWIIGHRTVSPDEHGGLYRSQFKGRLVQINRPEGYVVALVPPDGNFRPELDVMDLARTDHLNRMAGLFEEHWA